MSKLAVCVLIVNKKTCEFLSVSLKEDHTDFNLPGGSVEKGETFKEAGIREVKEETGVTVYNLKSLYDPNANFTHLICKYGDNGQVYSEAELKKYKDFYAKKMGKEYFFDLFSNTSKEHFKFFFNNYQNSKYYKNIKKIYYYLLK